MDLSEKLQQHFGYKPLLKIDPNTQRVKETEVEQEDRFAQSAIPTAIIGLYKFGSTDEGANTIISGGISSSWVDTVFKETAMDVVERIEQYSGDNNAEEKLNDVLMQAAAFTKEATAPENKIADVKSYLSAESTHVMASLPAVLHIGALVHDETIDDNTNKMEGPISTLMHKIGNAFSTPDKDEKLENNL